MKILDKNKKIQNLSRHELTDRQVGLLEKHGAKNIEKVPLCPFYKTGMDLAGALNNNISILVAPWSVVLTSIQHIDKAEVIEFINERKARDLNRFYCIGFRWIKIEKGKVVDNKIIKE